MFFFNPAEVNEAFCLLRNKSQLFQFVSRLDPGDPYQAAWLRYASSWRVSDDREHDATFDPRAWVSDDLSAALLGECPCIFMGSNNWALHAGAPFEKLSDKVRIFINHINHLIKVYPERKIVVIAVPEKDYLINRLSFNANDYSGMNSAMRHMADTLNANGVAFVFERPMLGMNRYQQISDFNYPDTHLPARNYLQIYAGALVSAGYDWRAAESRIRFELNQEYYDLSNKLKGHPRGPQLVYGPVFDSEEVILSSGFGEFQDPLGHTWQRLSNNNYLIDGTVLILGDSHSSIYSRRKLNYLFANTFKETYFYWNPCGVRGDVPQIDADLIILEISQRFIF